MRRSETAATVPGGIIRGDALALDFELRSQTLRVMRPSSRTAFESPVYEIVGVATETNAQSRTWR